MGDKPYHRLYKTPDGEYVIITGIGKQVGPFQRGNYPGAKLIDARLARTGVLTNEHKEWFAKTIKKQGDDPSQVEIMHIDLTKRGKGGLKRFAKGFLVGGLVKGISEAAFGKTEEKARLSPVTLPSTRSARTAPSTIPSVPPRISHVESNIEIQRMGPQGVQVIKIPPQKLKQEWGLADLNIHLIGSQASGKTHLWHMLKSMLPPQDYRTTTWGHFNLTALPIKTKTALLADTAGKSEFEDLNKTIEHYFPANLYLAVYDYHNIKSWNHIANEIKKIRERKPDAKILLLGNMRDAPDFLEGQHEGIPHYQFNFAEKDHVEKFVEKLAEHIR